MSKIIIFTLLVILFAILKFEQPTIELERENLSDYCEKISYLKAKSKIEEARIFAGKNFFLEFEKIIDIIQSHKNIKTLSTNDFYMLKATLLDVYKRYSENSQHYIYFEDYSVSNIMRKISVLAEAINEIEITELNQKKNSTIEQLSVPYTLYVKYNLLKLLEEKKIGDLNKILYIHTL